MKAKIDRRWFWRIVDFINPLRDPSLTVAVVLTFIEEAGQHDPWYWIIVIGLVNWLAVRGIVWLAVNFTFAPKMEGFAEETSEVPVEPAETVRLRPGDVLPLKLPSPE